EHMLMVREKVFDVRDTWLKSEKYPHDAEIPFDQAMELLIIMTTIDLMGSSQPDGNHGSLRSVLDFSKELEAQTSNKLLIERTVYESKRSAFELDSHKDIEALKKMALAVPGWEDKPNIVVSLRDVQDQLEKKDQYLSDASISNLAVGLNKVDVRAFNGKKLTSVEEFEKYIRDPKQDILILLNPTGDIIGYQHYKAEITETERNYHGDSIGVIQQENKNKDNNERRGTQLKDAL